jgi:excisionase family DNA binding protein
MNTHQVSQQLTEIQQQLQDRVFEQKEILNLQEAASLLCIAKSTLYKLTCKKVITFYKPSGKLILFKRQDLLQWVERNAKAASSNVKTQEVCHG